MALDNFALQNTNPLEAYLQGAGGIQTLQNNQQIMQQRQANAQLLQQQQTLAQQKAQAAQAAAQAKQQAQLTMYNETEPLKHAKLVAQYQTAYPNDYKAVTDASKTMSDAQKTNLLGLSSKLANVSATGNYELGQQILDQQVASMEGNVPDDQLAAAKTFQKRWAADPKGVVTGLTMAAYAIDPATYEANIKSAQETQGLKLSQPLEANKTVAQTEQATSVTRKNYFDIEDAKTKNEIERLKLLQAKSNSALEQQKLQVEIDAKTQTMNADKSDRIAAGRALVGGFAEMKNKALELLKDPNLDNILGSVEGRSPNLRESSAAVQSKLDTLKSGIFITVSPLLKGVSTAQDALDMKNSFAALNQTQDEKSFKTELKKLITLASKYEKQAREQFGQPDTGGAAGSGVATGQPAYDIKATSYGSFASK